MTVSVVDIPLFAMRLVVFVYQSLYALLDEIDGKGV